MTTGTTIGIIGAGQLGRMLALAGLPMGLSFEFLDTSSSAPAAELGTLHIGAFDDAAALAKLAQRVDVITFEVENVPSAALSRLTSSATLYPSVAVLQTAQDRLKEKTLFQTLQIPTARFIAVDSRAQLTQAANELGFPCVLKTRRMGYDGRGQLFLQSENDLDTAWKKFEGLPLILEQFVRFERELSLIAARNQDGDTVYYPLSDNTHKDGILHFSHAPFDNATLNATAQQYAGKLFQHFDYVGVLTIELFVTPDGLMANEIAPRVHNSGHWTIEGAATCQFENHLRAILNLPLGDTAPLGHSTMINFLGQLPDRKDCMAISGLHYHDYRKQPRPSRKIGHGTIVKSSKADCERQVEKLRKLYSPVV